MGVMDEVGSQSGVPDSFTSLLPGSVPLWQPPYLL